MRPQVEGDEAPVVFVIRDEVPADLPAIEAVIQAAFRDHPFSQQTEHLIVRGLRDGGALTLSLVATQHGTVLGHLALSPVRIGGTGPRWWGLGPVSVDPARQRTGIGSALIRSALRRLGDRGVGGCVVLGDPAYYARFGFRVLPGLVYPGVPEDHFLALPLRGHAPAGEVTYHPAFSQSAP